MSKHILITGATKGIGRACAKRFAHADWAITAVARTEADLQAMKEDFGDKKISTVVADLATCEGIEAVQALSYDVVLLNAATFEPGYLLATEDLYERFWQLNVRANHRLTRRLLPALRKQGAGHLVVIGSRGTDFQPAHMTAYVATKYALRGLFLGWESELLNSGVVATLVAPGATLTASWDGEVPPVDILTPETVAEVVWEVVRDGIGGRVTV
ncbi:MAG: SDR family NAD(P)-dependent oxidoreductase [Lewinella sp.]|nr:SDR family NAD(P)-dependent oxidoreductase [Lewinella sp.]